MGILKISRKILAPGLTDGTGDGDQFLGIPVAVSELQLATALADGECQIWWDKVYQRIYLRGKSVGGNETVKYFPLSNQTLWGENLAPIQPDAPGVDYTGVDLLIGGGRGTGQGRGGWIEFQTAIHQEVSNIFYNDNALRMAITDNGAVGFFKATNEPPDDEIDTGSVYMWLDSDPESPAFGFNFKFRDDDENLAGTYTIRPDGQVESAKFVSGSAPDDSSIPDGSAVQWWDASTKKMMFRGKDSMGALYAGSLQLEAV